MYPRQQLTAAQLYMTMGGANPYAARMDLSPLIAAGVVRQTPRTPMAPGPASLVQRPHRLVVRGRFGGADSQAQRRQRPRRIW